MGLLIKVRLEKFEIKVLSIIIYYRNYLFSIVNNKHNKSINKVRKESTKNKHEQSRRFFVDFSDSSLQNLHQKLPWITN